MTFDCYRSACGPPPPMDYMVVDEGKAGVLVNTIRKYTCVPGFHPTGPIEAICLGENGATYWKFNEHKCISKY